MGNGRQQSKRWQFTLFDYDGKDEERLRDCDGISYIVFGRELCPNTGRPHLQGYLECKQRKTMGGVKKLFARDSVHLEIASRDQKTNREYCIKNGDYYEQGEPMAQGARTDLAGITEQLKSGKRLRDIALSNPEVYCRFRSGLESLARFSAKPRSADRQPDVRLYWGQPGTGKTRAAREISPDDTWVYPGLGWFDGFYGQRVALFDDFGDDLSREGGITYSLFLQICDRYPMQVRVKGGFTEWNPEIIIFTANRPLEDFYVGRFGYVWEAVQRRFTEIKCFNYQ